MVLLDGYLQIWGMNKQCPNVACAFPLNYVRDGYFRRNDDSKVIQRLRCKSCGCRFSNATFSDAYRQKKRRVNFTLLKFLSSNMSQRRSALLLGVDRRTVARKLPYLAERCRRLNQKHLKKFAGRIHNIQIDDLITKENSKLKPLSVSIAVDENRRTILALEVSKIPAFGHLSKFAIKKYGKRKDEHFDGLKRLFEAITPIVCPEVLVKSDEHQRYPGFITAYLPKAKHLSFPSERGCIAGQGELKKVKFDPLFIVNHTCAQLRGSVNRLIRKTWCTTKDPERLKDHLDIFMYFHNLFLIKG
jgi:transposase-like protein